jgi:hypothetical protein
MRRAALLAAAATAGLLLAAAPAARACEPVECYPGCLRPPFVDTGDPVGTVRSVVAACPV